jgi:hypothetical protein
MKKLFVPKYSLIVFAVAIATTAPALAQFPLDQGTGDFDTRVSIKSTGPGAATLTFSNSRLVYLNEDPKVPGITPQTDVSGKGKVWIVPPSAAPAGVEAVMSGVGRGGWAIAPGGKLNMSKVKTAKFADTFTLPVTIDSAGQEGCAGFTLLVTKNGAVLPNVWVSKPGFLLTRGSGETDHTMVLCTDKAGTISMATAEQAKKYAPTYKAVTSVHQGAAANEQ